MTGHLGATQLVTVLLALAGAGIALAAGIGLVAVYVRLGDAVDVASTRRAFGLWAAGALLLAAGTPGAVRGSVAGVDALQSLALVAVALGALAVGLAPVYLWGATQADS
ncbi:hypothetical protein [Halobaculum lipolyticum]|uniref:Uncharacterized protein n=1 Tax=Halobaculum lipolyticum TaxID=3032001 RepID=A0ABD5W576_9EURY|nr:hypothetical protein [Halobaculum sp. DT31]